MDLYILYAYVFSPLSEDLLIRGEHFIFYSRVNYPDSDESSRDESNDCCQEEGMVRHINYR